MSLMNDIDKMENEKDVNGLITALSDSDDVNIRKKAAELLGDIGDARGIDVLIETLEDPDTILQFIASESLSKIGESAVAPLTKLRYDQNEKLQNLAAITLEKINYQTPPKAEFNNLSEIYDEFGEVVNIDPLLDGLNSQDEGLRWESAAYATEIIGYTTSSKSIKIIELLIELLNDPNEDVRFISKDSLEYALVNFNEYTIEPLKNSLSSSEHNKRELSAIILSLTETVPIETLIEALENPDERIRREAAKILSEYDNPIPIENLIEILRNDKSQERDYASDILDEIGESTVIKKLIKLLDDDGMCHVAKEALELIGPLGQIELQKNQDKKIKFKGKNETPNTSIITDPVIVEQLGKLLDDDEMGQMAKMIIMQIGLIVALETENQEAQTGENYSNNHLFNTNLPNKGQTKSEEEYHELENIRKFVRSKNVKVAPIQEISEKEKIGILINDLKSPSSDVRNSAVEKLSEIGEPAFEAVVRASWTDEVTKRKICDIFGEIADPRGVKHLIRLLGDSDPYVRRRAANALQYINDEYAIIPLIKALKDREKKVRERAGYALAGYGHYDEYFSDPRPNKDKLKKNASLYALINICIKLDGDKIFKKNPHVIPLLEYVPELGEIIVEYGKLLKSDDPEIRFNVVKDLIEMNRSEFEFALENIATNDPDEQVKEIAQTPFTEISNIKYLENYPKSKEPLDPLLNPEVKTGRGKDDFLKEGLIHQTIRGEYVRSKSEVIIADQLYFLGVNYEYEGVLEFDGEIRRPDFVIKSKSGKIYYWEHLGMLNNYSYRKNWDKKKKWYLKNGITENGGPNGTLIETRDNSDGGISSKEVNMKIKKILQ